MHRPNKEATSCEARGRSCCLRHRRPARRPQVSKSAAGAGSAQAHQRAAVLGDAPRLCHRGGVELDAQSLRVRTQGCQSSLHRVLLPGTRPPPCQTLRARARAKSAIIGFCARHSKSNTPHARCERNIDIELLQMMISPAFVMITSSVRSALHARCRHDGAADGARRECMRDVIANRDAKLQSVRRA